MPFYEYECSKCGYRDEVLQKVSDSPLKKCPSCGKSALKKLMSAPVFRLKGSGWYETDFKSDKDKQRNLAGAERDEKKDDAKPAEGDAANKSTETKSEAKPESKSEPKAEAATSKGRKPAAPAKKASKRPAPKPKRRARK